MKVLQAVYAYHQTQVKDIKASRTFLKKSIEGIEDTYANLFQFPQELFHFIKLNYNPADKHLKVSGEANYLFNYLTNNSCLNLLIQHPKTKHIFNQPSFNWAKDADFLLLIYRQLIELDWVKEMSEQADFEFENSKLFLIRLYKYLIEISEDFNIKMEEINIHWQDEKYSIVKSLEKFIKTCDADGIQIETPLMSKDLDDDMDFANNLLDFSAKNHQAYEDLISERTPDWDPERIARIDLYIMIMALAEFLEIAVIPVKVTLNEYLELAKIYSTPQSSKFINGVLDKLLNELKKEGRIVKKGRGLVE